MSNNLSLPRSSTGSHFDLIKCNENCLVFSGAHRVSLNYWYFSFLTMKHTPFVTPLLDTHMYIHILTPQCVQYVGESNCAYYYSLLLRMLCQMRVNHKGHLLGLIAGGHVAHMTAWKHVRVNYGIYVAGFRKWLWKTWICFYGNVCRSWTLQPQKISHKHGGRV